MFIANATTNVETLFTDIPSPLAPLFTVSLNNGFERIEHHNLTEVEAIALAIACDEHNLGQPYPEVIPQEEVLAVDWYTISAVAGFATDSQYIQAALIQMQERDEIEKRKAEQLAHDHKNFAGLINACDRWNAEVDAQYELIGKLELQLERAQHALGDIKRERDVMEARLYRVLETQPLRLDGGMA